MPWHLLIQAGRTDPEPAPPEDPEGYEARIREAYPDIFSALELGDTIADVSMTLFEPPATTPVE